MAAPGHLWTGARSSMRGGVSWSAVLVLLLTLSIARSTATAAWVGGMEVVPLIALSGALLMAALAVLPIRWPLALGFGMILGPIAAAVAAGPVIRQMHPQDGGIGVWWTRLADGSAASDPSFYLFLICWLMWVTGAWLSWCVLRWRKPMLGLVPGAAAFAANLLNFPRDQNGYNFTILVLTLALLLWTNYTGSIASATRAHVKLTGDARWDFWESGLVAMAALIVIAIMLPPLSTIDRTLDVESSAFSNWAQLQQRLSHPGIIGNGPGGSGTTGFAADVPLGGPLARTRDPVFYYTIIGDFTGPRYFRGLNMTTTSGSEWKYPGSVSFIKPVPKNQVMVYGEDYSKLALSAATVTMQRPPAGFSDVIFYPGALYKLDRDAVAMQVALPEGRYTNLTSIDRLSAVRPSTSAGKYAVTVEYSIATVVDLEAAGTNYPAWLQNFSSLPETGYRNPDVERQIRDLAVKVVTAAGATNPYDKATAIQDFLRENYTYTLSPPTRPVAVDPLEFFLFRSKKGYCEYFASAMGDMLRALGIPTRLVNGFGPGAYDTTIQSFVVRGADAHTWVEAYFPSYGWIPFEPTPDVSGGYLPLPRGTQGQNVCVRDQGCNVPGSGSGDTAGVAPTTDRPRGAGPNDPGGGTSTFPFRVPDAGTLSEVAAILFAVILVLLAGVARYLRPRSVMGVWKRTLVLSQLAGAKRGPGETPLELGRRLQQRFPEASEPVGALAGGFAIAAYAPHEEAASARSSVMEAWSALRPMLVRRVLARLRPNRG
jgi:transglutaminase-like putative cysteine protease